MSYPIVENFKGYNAKVDRKLNDPAIGSNCNNVIINQGNLCNMPMSDRRYSSSGFQHNDENLCAIYYYSVKMGNDIRRVAAFVIFNSKGEIWINNYDFDSSRPNEQFTKIIFNDFGEIIRLRNPERQDDSRTYNSSHLTTLTGNVIQVNDWLMFLCQTGTELPTVVAEEFLKTYPQMFRLRFPGRKLDSLNLEYHYLRSPVGLAQPVQVRKTNTQGGGSVTGQALDFGFSFALDLYDFNLDQGTPATLESNVTILDDPTTYGSSAITFRIFLPTGHTTLFPFGVKKVNVYLKKQEQSVYYYWLAINIGGETIGFDASRAYVDIVVNASIATQDTTRPAPLTSVTPIPGAHDPPKLATHGCYFKGRMYYNCLEFANLLQVSAVTPLNVLETGEYANYIEWHEFVGKASEPINGLIEFLGQVIIFKEESTHVLTDAIGVGEVRPLFHDIGCVKGGKAYEVIENKLYFGSSKRKGIYFYDGSGVSPVKISEAIEKDLQKISSIRYQYMRLSHDALHKLLFVSFPMGFGCNNLEVVPTFIFHYELGVWTKTDQISQCISNEITGDVMYIRRNRIEAIKSIDEEVNLVNAIEWFWQSSVIDLGHAEKVKEFLWTKLETIPELSDNLKIKTTFYDGLGNEVLGGSQDIMDLEKKKLRKINSHKKALMIKLSGTTRVPFRITGLDLEGFVAGVM